jgi:hypothetical protein
MLNRSQRRILIDHTPRAGQVPRYRAVAISGLPLQAL